MALSLYEIAEALSLCACEALAAQDPPWEGECCVEPGAVSHDSCCEAGGQVWARFVRTYPTTDFPRADESTDQSSCMVQWAHQFEVGSIRCVCFDMCDCEVKQDNAAKVLGDTEALLRGVLCCFATGSCSGLEYRVTGQEPIGPGGGCGGSRVYISVLGSICCPPDGSP